MSIIKEKLFISSMIDLHMHTTYSDGKNSIEDMVKMAMDVGLKKIAITDHVWRDSLWFDNYIHEIEILRKNGKIEILIGFEAKALSTNGEIDATNNMCRKSDVRIGAIHRIPESDNLNSYLSRGEIEDDPVSAYNNWLITVLNMIKNSNVDIIAHPCMVVDKYNFHVKQRDIYNLFKTAHRYNKKLEISMRYKKSNMYLLKTIEEYPIFITNLSYGSDAHSIWDLQKNYNFEQ